MATFNSLIKPRAKWQPAVALLIFFAAAGTLLAGESTNDFFAGHARSEYNDALSRFQADSANPTNAWQFARACYDIADLATNDDERAIFANQAITACRQVIERYPKSAAAHYYLGMNLGQLARTELLGALGLVRDMEREFKTAANLDPHFDFAGPERNLGLLYYMAPGIGSIGSNRKARDYLERAAKLAPDYPENHLNLAETFLKWDEPDEARRELNLLDAIWSKAQANLTGAAWAQSWYDWSNRRAAVEKKLDKVSTK